MADKLTAKATAALIERVAPDMSNKQLARLSGTAQANTVTRWKRDGMPREKAALLVHRLALDTQAEAARKVLQLTDVIREFGL